MISFEYNSSFWMNLMFVGTLVEGVAPAPECPELIVWHGAGALLKEFLGIFLIIRCSLERFSTSSAMLSPNKNLLGVSLS